MATSSRFHFLRRALLLVPVLMLALCGTMGRAWSDGDVTVTITQTGAWNGGYGANIDIVNGTGQAIENWTLKFDFSDPITSLWNGAMTQSGSAYTVTPETWNGTIPAGGKVELGLNANGVLTKSTASNATVNGAPAEITTTLSGGGGGGGGTPTGAWIEVVGVEGDSIANQFTIPQGVTTFDLKLNGSAATPKYDAISSNESVVTAAITADGKLALTSHGAGRSGLRLTDSASGAVRIVGVRVKDASGIVPDFPNTLTLGSVSEDTDGDLNFWHDIQPGPKNKRMDVRYIYLNGGPQYGWITWTSVPGDRAIKYIHESQKMGMVPFFVFYNIPDGGESYTTDRDHLQSADYMKQYYQMLKFTLDIINKESPDDPVGIILEPDSLGYMAQNEPGPASGISAMTHAAYDAGVLTKGTDPDFPDTVQGVVKSINYIISKYSPKVYFGWQMNLWASKAGGWTTSVPGTGLMHKTDDLGVAQGRPLIYNEAAAITQYYLDAGVTSYGAKFISIDKYGLDAASAEASAAQNPAGSLWFWNNDHWNNYLTFVQAMHDTTKLPVVLWQLPVGHINHSKAQNPYDASAVFPDLPNSNRQSEDSAPTFFFGDTFTTDGARLSFFSRNDGSDSKLTVSGSDVTWGEHMSDAAKAGVTMALFGAGVGASTTNVGAPPTDSYWWITKAEEYYAHPVPLTPTTPAVTPGDVNADGVVNVADATLVLRFIVGLATGTPDQNAAADANADTQINIADVTWILRKAVGIGG